MMVDSPKNHLTEDTRGNALSERCRRLGRSHAVSVLMQWHDAIASVQTAHVALLGKIVANMLLVVPKAEKSD
jgi:hypothetical protein